MRDIAMGEPYPAGRERLGGLLESAGTVASGPYFGWKIFYCTVVDLRSVNDR